MKFQIINTGSDGNCFVVDDELMIDAGVVYKKLTTGIDIEKIKYVMLTHIHGDHFNKTAIRKIYINNENVVFYCGWFLEKELINIGVPSNNIHVIDSGLIYRVGDFVISPIELYHDVPNFGYRIMKDGHKHIHATDTSSLFGITAKNYHSASIECNYQKDDADRIIKDAENNNEFTHLKRAIQTHLSVEQTIDFCIENNIKKLIPVHIGSITKKGVNEKLKCFFDQQ